MLETLLINLYKLQCADLVGDGPARDVFDADPGNEFPAAARARTLIEGELLVRAQLDQQRHRRLTLGRRRGHP